MRATSYILGIHAGASAPVGIYLDGEGAGGGEDGGKGEWRGRESGKGKGANTYKYGYIENMYIHVYLEIARVIL